MKSKILSLIALAATLVCGSAFAAPNGDIWDIRACNATGQDIAKANLPLYTADDAMIAGDTAYFKVRFYPLEKVTPSSENMWKMTPIGAGAEYSPFQIGIFVSGQLTYAEYAGRLIYDDNKITDIIFKYKVLPGDFALPIVLALNSNGTPVPASDSKAKNTSSYYVNTLNPYWELRWYYTDGSYKSADWYMFAEPSVVIPEALSGLEQIGDASLSKAGFCAKTIDFDSSWETNDVVWRVVHEGSTIIDGKGISPKLVAVSEPTQKVDLYVWSTNEDVVVVSGDDVYEVETVNPAKVSEAMKIHVKKVTFAMNQLSSDFSIEGVSQTVNNGWAGLVLSAYDHYNVSDATSDLIKDFVVVPVRCSDPLPPSVIVEADREIATATSDYKERAATLTVKLSQSVSQQFKVKVTPSLADGKGEVGGTNIYDYVRFSTTQSYAFPEAGACEVTLGGGIDSATINVFCLRGDKRTVNDGIRFTPSCDVTVAEIQEWRDTVMQVEAQQPVIEEPTSESVISATRLEETPMTIKVTDTYADTHSATGYDVYYRLSGDSTWTAVSGKFLPDGIDNILYNVDGGELPKMTFKKLGEQTVEMYVKAPESGKTSVVDGTYCSFTVNVSAAKSVTLATQDGGKTYDEGTSVYFTIQTSEVYDEDLYAFIKAASSGVKEDLVGRLEAPFIIGKEDCTGRPLDQNGYAEEEVKLLDGTTAGLNIDFEVVLATVADYATATNKNKIVKVFHSNTMTLKVMNLEPSVENIVMNGTEKTKKSGYEMKNKVPKKQPQTFKVNVTDPSDYDLAHNFKFKWSAGYYLEDGSVYPMVTDREVEGTSETLSFDYSFNVGGKWRIDVWPKDKDMSKYPGEDESYWFDVEVLSNPSVVIDAEEIYSESDYQGVINVGLSYFDPSCDPLTVCLTVEKGDPTVTGDYGEFELKTYEVTLDSTETKSVRIANMDGTVNTKIYGWRITGTVTNLTENPQTGESWSNYYNQGVADITVENVIPNNGEFDETFSPRENTNAWSVASGLCEDRPITITLIDDARLDWTNGITVKITGADGSSYTTLDGFTNGVRKFYAPASYTYYPTFSVQGEQSVTITVTDKDRGTISGTWLYDVEASKMLSIRPNGPTTGYGAACSKKYSAQAGLGSGRIWASGLSGNYDKTTKAPGGHSANFNCGKANTWSVYAYGYKVGDKDTGNSEDYHFPSHTQVGYYPSRTVKSMYEYTDTELDSFLYAFLQVSRGSSSSDSGTQTLTDSLLNSAISPEYSEKESSGQTVALPTKKGDTSSDSTDSDATYDETLLEAIFSKELLPSDNMGDINWDGVPDIFYAKYTFTVTTTSTTDGPGGGTTTTEETELADLSTLTDYNEDYDYLPGNLSAWTSVFSDPSLTNAYPFTAKQEIRGFGDCLNDATASVFPDSRKNLCAVDGVKPDVCYSDPATDSKSTLSALEYMAWQEYAWANLANPSNPEYDPTTDSDNWSKWSPERPTNPTLADTDGDGISDGYEYYFWYRAHVGYLDEKGKHCYMTGRRYDPKNPGKGVLITSAEIEQLFDPIVDAGVSALVLDTDNDGIPDLLEFNLGTNPVDFDTDADGLPDGWELMIAGLDPLMACTSLDAQIDALRNYDGDAMAITSSKRESSVLPKPLNIATLTSFAVVDADGDTDGTQWYVFDQNAVTNLTFAAGEPETGTKITIAGVDYVTTAENVTVVKGTTRLANTLTRANTFKLATDENYGADPIRTTPTNITAGTVLDAEPQTEFSFVSLTVTSVPSEKKVCNAAWVYGRDLDSTGDYGFLALARYAKPNVGDILTELPLTSDKREVCYLHYLVYQQYGYDARTAWSSSDPIASRWVKTVDGESIEGTYSTYASKPTRTREYATYDEFLLYSFFLNNGCNMTYESPITDSSAPTLAHLWGAFTTNPQGPNEPGAVRLSSSDTTDSDSDTVQYYGRDSENGCDTDGDGVPDGWELYVMSGPKETPGMIWGEDGLVFAPAYAGFNLGNKSAMTKSYLSPFVGSAGSTYTCNTTYMGAGSDQLTELREFSGTDSSAHYANVMSNATTEVATILPREQQSAGAGVYVADDSKWLNKFFPTDPWNDDTDGDGVYDNENTYFIYGSPKDDGKLWSIPGGGLNPCTVDTDGDGLPDGWEAQFKGNTIWTGEAKYAIDGSGDTGRGNPLQGLMDGMDGTVQDAYNLSGRYTATETSGIGYHGEVNRDYDHDGLENWQEYLVGTMRCWRYDDPHSGWTYIESYPTNVTGAIDAEAAAVQLGLPGGADEFWYQTLVDKTSKVYNPNLAIGMGASAQYFSPVTNGFDWAYTDVNIGDYTKYYYFYHRIADASIGGSSGGLWVDAYQNWSGTGILAQPRQYISCSPIKADSDGDGMDDYYELFHGLNPLLGKSGVAQEKISIVSGQDDSGSDTTIEASADERCCDLVYTAWHQSGCEDNLPFNALDNPWYSAGNEYDFVKCPWLNGLATADPDGDDIRNQEEAIMPMLATTTWHHTDPTPLWMTDSSHSNSLVRKYWKLPNRMVTIPLTSESFTWEGREYKFSDFVNYVPAGDMTPAYFNVFQPDVWNLLGSGKDNWMFSFEENEGYDTDHDGLSDYDELNGKFRSATSPQNFDSPRRRQAMYFQGPSRPSVLQSMPFAAEEYPLANSVYPDEMAFLRYTVECWVYPTSVADSTIIERSSWVEPSAKGDKEYLRRNFQLAIKNGKWYTKFDSRGTLDNSYVEAIATSDAKVGVWTHIAATYDCNQLIIYVNGKAEAATGSNLQPEYGAGAIALDTDQEFWHDYAYPLNAIILGASVKAQADGATDGSALNVANAGGINKNYKDFYAGYIDEVRIWDGARTGDQIRNAMMTRYNADTIKTERDTFYDVWESGQRRYNKDESGNEYNVDAELRFHYTFDAVFAADNEESAGKAPLGFVNTDGKAYKNRPSDYAITWWKNILDACAAEGNDSVYNNPAWAVWIHNTVAHLPRYDGTTLDSTFWSTDFRGTDSGSYSFVRDAEPVSRWTQMKLHQATVTGYYCVPSFRHYFVNASTNSAGGNFDMLFEFTGRTLNQCGDDLIPLGGAYVKYCDSTVNMWDDQGASSNWEIGSTDSDLDGIPDWWETYADQNYRLGTEPFAEIKWNTPVLYHDLVMTAGEAYLRDIAKGFYRDEDGLVVTDTESGAKYRQTADENANGLPDWWEELYGLEDEDPLADHDNDGLSNYTEYMLSEVFAFKGIQFSPIKACSVDPFTPDYFYRVGMLYVGEIFADHDLVDDSWEDTYNAYSPNYTSRLRYDAFSDYDEDGWSNRSENRYSNQSLPIIASERYHYSTADGIMADYPIPTLTLTLNYNGYNSDSVDTAPIIVKAISDATANGGSADSDATFEIGKIEETKGTGTGESSSSSSSTDNSVAYTRNIGAWSERHVIGTLTPGNIMANSVALDFCYDPNSLVYCWEEYYGDNGSSYRIKRGTRTEYDAARRKYGDEWVLLLSTTSAYATLADLELKTEPITSIATWIHTRSGKTLGTINLKTGAFDLDLSVFKDQYVIGTNENDKTCLEDQTFRISYSANPAISMPRTLYLGQADQGYLHEGKNTIVAFADSVEENGEWDPGEPYGFVRDVDISWSGTSAEIELKEQSPMGQRVNVWDDESDRSETRSDVYTKIEESGLATGISQKPTELVWMVNNTIKDVGTLSQIEPVHVRVVRWLVNNRPVYRFFEGDNVVVDKYLDYNSRKHLNEVDFLANGGYDLDWKGLRNDIIEPLPALGVTNVKYLVVIGDGHIGWDSIDDTNTVVYALNQVISRHFGAERVLPTPLEPGNAMGIVDTALPTFKWSLDCPALEDYTAFQIKVANAAGKTIWTSGIQLAPPRDADGIFQWQAPLYVGDKTLAGYEFVNKTNYTWQVAMYNAKYSDDEYSSASQAFRLNVQTNGYDKGTAHCAVRYFGPSVSYKGKTIRVRAYATPDFSGQAVAGGYVKYPDDDETGLVVTGREAVANCDVVGLPRGSYYLQAFIDSNNDGVCDKWESQGYFCDRTGNVANYLDPKSLTFADSVGYGDLATIYLEDSDTDSDGLPDAWEYAVYGSLTAKGIELVSETPAGEALINAKLTSNLELQENAAVPAAGVAGLMSSSLSNAGTLSLALGLGAPSEDATFGSLLAGEISEELAEDGVKISSVEFDENGGVVIKVEAETEVKVGSTSILSQSLATSTSGIEVTCELLWKQNLSDPDWTVLKSETITVGAGEATISRPSTTSSNGGFYKVRLSK